MTDEQNDEQNIGPDFGSITSGMFGPVESTVGPDQYNANVENTKSMTAGNHALVAVYEARAKQREAVSFLVYALVLLAIPPYLMVLVYLFKQLVI